MMSDYQEPLNLGRDRMVTINQLAEIVIGISGKNLSLKHVSGPQGVRGRNSDNTRLREVLGWEPTTPLEIGLVPTYQWIQKMVENADPSSTPRPEGDKTSVVVDLTGVRERH